MIGLTLTLTFGELLSLPMGGGGSAAGTEG